MSVLHIDGVGGSVGKPIILYIQIPTFGLTDANFLHVY